MKIKSLVAAFWTVSFIGVWYYQESLLHHSLFSPSLSSVVLIIMVQIALSVLLLPCSFLTVIISLLWGFDLGFWISYLSTFISASVTYALGYTIIQRLPFVQDWNVLVRARMFLGSYKPTDMFILYLNPVFPGSSMGYVFAVARVRPRIFIVTTLIGLVPLQVLMSIFGSTAALI